MAKKLTSKKAREILHDKSVHGHPLTDKQRKYFGYIASGGTPKAQASLLGGIQPDYRASDISHTVRAPMMGILPLAEQERLQKQYEAQRFAQQQMQNQSQIKRGLSSAERAAGEEYKREIEKRKAIANAPLTQTIAMGAPSGITEGTLQAAGEGSKLILEGTPAFSASRLINALNPNRDVYFQKEDPLWRKGLGMLGVVGDVANVSPIALPLVKSAKHALDMQFSPTGRQLRGVEQMVRELGGTDWDVAAQQMESVGITPKQRMGYFPGVSEFGSRYGYPFSYGGQGGETKFAQTFRNFRQGKDFRPGKKDYGDIAPARSDSWRLYLGLPQKQNTFELASSSPFNHPMYTPEVLKNMELFSLKSPDALSSLLPFEMTPSYGPLVKGVRFGNFLSNTPTVSVRAGEPSHYLNREAWQALNKEITDTEGNIVMGGYNTRLNNLGFEYTDVWDLHPDFSLSSVLPNRVSNYLANNSLTRGLFSKETKQGFGTIVEPRKFKIKVENYFGKPFMSYDIFPEYNSALHTKLLRKASLDKLRKTRLAGEGEDALEFGQQLPRNIYTPEYQRQKKYQNLGKALEDLRLNYPKRQMGGKVGKGGLGVIADTGDDIVMPQDGMVQKAQAPGYQGLGYSNKGYEYNSAWGGRFQAAGTILNNTRWNVINKEDEEWKQARAEKEKRTPKHTLQYAGDKEKTWTVNKKNIDRVIAAAIGMDYDPKKALAVALQESNLGMTDRNTFHILDDPSTSQPTFEMAGIQLLKDKEKYAHSLGYNDPIMELQAFNGFGRIKPTTEQRYHGFKMKKAYGVPLPEEGISMKENPLYGKRVLDYKANVIDNDPYINERISYWKNFYANPESTFYTETSDLPEVEVVVKKPRWQPGQSFDKPKSKEWTDFENIVESGIHNKRVAAFWSQASKGFGPSPKKQMGGTMYARTGQDWKPKNISKRGGTLPSKAKYNSPSSVLEKRIEKAQMQMGGGIPISSQGLREFPNQEVIVPTVDGRITMEDIDYPVDAIDEYGTFIRMQPGGEYQFPGRMIKETPVKRTEQDRGQLKKLDQLTNFTNYNNG